jgi:hypothetical protein
MTVSSTVRTAGPFTGSGTVATFPFAFKVFSSSDLAVSTTLVATGIPTALDLNTDYTASLNVNQDSNPGGTITLTAGPLAAGNTLSITSDMAILQQTELTNQGGFYPEVITAALDRLTILLQQLQVSIDTILSGLLVQPCTVTTQGTVYTAPGNVAAVFVNGSVQAPSDYTAVGPVITFNYELEPEDNVNALCTSI